MAKPRNKRKTHQTDSAGSGRTREPGPRISRLRLAQAAVIVLVVLAAYYPAVHAGFIWDDDEYVTHNPLLMAPDGLFRIWFSLDSPSQYFPLTYTSFLVERAAWGLNPAGYHIVNILLHAANALLVWLLLARLGIPGAWLAAAIWAAHPVQVESVAWISERKNVLSTLFFLLALINWNGFLDNPGRARRYYSLSILCAALALLAKTTAVTLPGVMLLMLWWKRMRIGSERLVQLLPFAAMSAAMGLITLWWEKVHQGTRGELFDLSAAERLLVGSRALWFYLSKLLFPHPLIFSYPRWHIDPGNPAQYIPLAALVAVAAALWLKRDVLRSVTAAGLFFVVALSPMLGIFSLWTFRYTFVADHYQYLASLGPIALAAAVVSLLRNAGPRTVLSAALLILLAALSFNQSRTYRSAETVWNDVLRKNPASSMALNNLGVIYYHRGERQKGLELVKRALAEDPRNAEAHLNLGVILREEGKAEEAIASFRQALRWLPHYARPHAELCSTLADRGNYDEALRHGEEAVRLDPNSALARAALGSALAGLGRFEEAAERFEQAVKLDPNLADAHYNLGMAKMQLGRYDEAEAAFSDALRLNPELGGAARNLAVIYYFKQDYPAAWDMVRTAEKAGQAMPGSFLKALSEAMPEPAQ